MSGGIVEPHTHVIHQVPTLEQLAAHPHSPEGVLARELLALRDRIRALEREQDIMSHHLPGG